MQEILRKGYWCWQYPRGYEHLNKGSKAVEREVIINEEGKLLKKAIKQKIKLNLTDTETVEVLASWGMKIDIRRFQDILKNPFYSGVIVNQLIPNEVIDAKHPAIISPKDFALINNIKSENRHQPFIHRKEDENLPLKVFAKCEKCSTPITGYIVKKKNLYYYKCRVKGCKNNNSAKKIHESLIEIIKEIRVASKYKKVLSIAIGHVYEQFTKESEQIRVQANRVINDLKKKLEIIDEREMLKEITTERYLSYKSKYEKEIEEREQKNANPRIIEFEPQKVNRVWS